MHDNIYVIEFLMKQKQERLETKARHYWMFALRTEKSKKPKQVAIINPQPACCPAV